MHKVLSTFALLILIEIIMYVLYINGYFVINAKRAIMYAGFMGGRKAAFTSCTGYTKRIVRFQNGGNLHFHFDLSLSKGRVVMELLDASKQRVLKLDQTQTDSATHIDANKRYYLIVRFQSASGSYLISWD